MDNVDSRDKVSIEIRWDHWMTVTVLFIVEYKVIICVSNPTKALGLVKLNQLGGLNLAIKDFLFMATKFAWNVPESSLYISHM